MTYESQKIFTVATMSFVVEGLSPVEPRRSYGAEFRGEEQQVQHAMASYMALLDTLDPGQYTRAVGKLTYCYTPLDGTDPPGMLPFEHDGRAREVLASLVQDTERQRGFSWGGSR